MWSPWTRWATRFNGTAEQILWNYESILDVLETRGVASNLTKSLRHTVCEIKAVLLMS